MVLDTLRVSMTGELEEEIKSWKGNLKRCWNCKRGIKFVSCPTCGRIEADLVKCSYEIEKRTAHIKTPMMFLLWDVLNKCNRWNKKCWCFNCFGKGSGLIMKKKANYRKLSGDALINKFIEEVEIRSWKEKIMKIKYFKFSKLF